MSLPKSLIDHIVDLENRVKALEGANQVKNLKIPTGGKLVLPVESTPPAVESGRVYVTTTEFKVCINGVWKTVTVS